jgi:hypothetical protein
VKGGSSKKGGYEKDPLARVTQAKLNMVKVLCLIQFVSASSFSQMAPFYPIKAVEKGVT